MNIEDFKIGEIFYAKAGFQWLCTDKGTRTILAIMLDPNKDEKWFKGPPYLLSEVVFDNEDMEYCYTDEYSMIIDRIKSSKTTAHPNFDSEDVFKMIDEKENNNYPHRKLLKRDRISNTGRILHPYAAIKVNEEWFIKTFEIFDKEYITIKEDVFISFKIATEDDMFKRKQQL